MASKEGHTSFSTSYYRNLIKHKRSHSDFIPYKCDYCDKEFIFLRYLKNHSKSCDPKINTYSSESKQESPSDSLEKEHNLSEPEKSQHSGFLTFECKDCQKTYQCAYNLRRHKKSKLHINTQLENISCSYSKREEDLIKPKSQNSGSQTFKCDVCDKRFSSAYTLKSHINSHSSKKQFKCKLCDFVSNWSSCLKRHAYLKHAKENHKNTPSSEEKYECTLCDYVGGKPNSLKQHLLTHTQEKLQKSISILDKQYKCKFCDYTGEYPNSLKKHLLTHSKEKLYQCDYCDHRSNYIRHLKIHILNHKGEKPYRCKYCLFKSSDQNTIRKHIRKVHSKATLYSCDLCDFKSKYKQQMINHIRSRHPEEKNSKYIESDFCNEIVKSPFSGHNKQNHSVKVYKCDKCTFKTTNNNTFDTHIKCHFNANRRRKFIELCNTIGKMEQKTKNVPCLTSQLKANLLILRSNFPVTSGVNCQSYSDDIQLPSILLGKGTEKNEELLDTLNLSNEEICLQTLILKTEEECL